MWVSLEKKKMTNNNSLGDEAHHLNDDQHNMEEEDYNPANSYGVSSRLNKRFDQIDQKQPLLSSEPSNNQTSSRLPNNNLIPTATDNKNTNLFDKLEDKKVSMSPLDGLYETKAGFLILKFAKYCMRVFGLFMVLLAVV